jgi:hypothetical protein
MARSAAKTGHQDQGGDLTETAGAGGQRAPGGSTRDSEKENRHA